MQAGSTPPPTRAFDEWMMLEPEAELELQEASTDSANGSSWAQGSPALRAAQQQNSAVRPDELQGSPPAPRRQGFLSNEDLL